MENANAGGLAETTEHGEPDLYKRGYENPMNFSSANSGHHSYDIGELRVHGMPDKVIQEMHL